MGKRSVLTQAAITRAVKALQASGMAVAEIVATREGVRIITKDGRGRSDDGAVAAWEKAIGDG